MAKNIDFMGAVYSDVPSVRLPQQGGGLVGFDDTTDATATAEDIAQGKTAYVNGQKVTGTGTGGTPVINPLSVTENGTYTAPSGVDGYSPVTVNVSGGGGSDAEDGIITKTLSGTYINDRVSKIGEFVFRSCNWLQSVRFLSVTSIGGSAFLGCGALETANIPEATYIGSYAFSGCQSLQNASFLKAVEIGAFAFSSCFKLETISFPEATSVRYSAFAQCSSLLSAHFPKLRSVDENTFNGCRTMTTVDFPEALTIGKSAFCYCFALSDTSFPKASSIYSYAFGFCSSLSSISLPMISVFYASAFRSCVNLVELHLDSVPSVPTLQNSNAFNSTPIGGYSDVAGQYGSIYVPASLYASFQTATNWQVFSSRMVNV